MKPFPIYWLAVLAVLLLAIGPAACSSNDDDSGDDDAGDDDAGDDDDDPNAFRLTSSAFEHLGAIPAKYTCENEDLDRGLSPPLAWVNVPDGTVAFAVTVRDPDAPDGDTKHWGLINIPTTFSTIDEGISPEGTRPAGSWETLNYRGETEYAGPCPPPADDAHRYNFTLYALSAEVPDPGTDTALDDVLPDLDAATIETTTLTGLFDR